MIELTNLGLKSCLAHKEAFRYYQKNIDFGNEEAAPESLNRQVGHFVERLGLQPRRLRGRHSI